MAALAASALTGGAQAQSACDRLKETLAARITPGARGFTLEAVPADADVPAGAKVIGSCEGGARKILLRRGTAASAVAAAASPHAPAVRARATAPPPAPTAPLAASAPVAASAPAMEQPPSPAPEPTPQAAPAALPAAPTGTPPGSRWWPWLAGAALLAAALAWLAAWIRHRRAYDAAGLPRGPRLN